MDFALGHCEFQFRWMKSGLRTHFSFGALQVSFRLMESDILRTHLCFSFVALWGSVQVDRRWVTTGPMWF